SRRSSTWTRSADVVLVVPGERAHEDAQPAVASGVLLDRVVAHTARLELGALLGLDLVRGHPPGRVEGEVAEVGEAPQRELGCAAVLGVRLHLVGKPQPRHLDLVAELLVLHGLGGGRDATGW